MMIVLTDDKVQGRQELMVPSGDGTSLWFLAGSAVTSFNLGANPGQGGNKSETYRLLLGPQLTGAVRAIAMVTPASVELSRNAWYSVQAVEADLDDESARIQLMFEIQGRITPDPNLVEFVNIERVSYHVTIRGQEKT